MKRMMKKLALALPVAALGLASSAHAGYTYDVARCYANTDGSGYCYGNMLGFRNDVYDTTYAQFYQYDTGAKYFYARYTVAGATSPSTYSCSAPSAQVAAMWQEATLHHGYFYIGWDANGNCNNLSLYNGSLYSNF